MPIAPQSLNSIEVPDWMHESIPSGIHVLDEFINGEGLHPGQVVTVSASRGTGKTTLLLQLLNGQAKSNPYTSVLYVSREEPAYQLKKTAQRVGVDQNIAVVGDETELTLEEFVQTIPNYKVVVLDSFSLLKADEFMNDGAKMKLLKDAAKKHQVAMVIVLHQTKDGNSKGSSDIEHLADTVIDIERADPETFGDDKTRILKMDKNRFGSCGQIILKLERTGWDFDNPVDESVNNDANKTENTRNTPQAKKPKELADIMKVAMEKTRFTFSDISHLIPSEEGAAIGRFERHLKELEKFGKVISIGRGKDKVWEYVS
jgi:predicted ATP-dependent serine protease